MYCSVLHHPSLRSAKLFPLWTRKRVIAQSDNEGPQWPEVKFQDVVVGEILLYCLYETVGFPCTATWFIMSHILLHGVTCWSGSAETVKNFHKEFLLLFGSADCSRTNRAGGHATSHCHGCLYWAGENVRHRVISMPGFCLLTSGKVWVFFFQRSPIHLHFLWGDLSDIGLTYLTYDCIWLSFSVE